MKILFLFLLSFFISLQAVARVTTDTLPLETGTIHLGDGSGSQGISYTRSFFLTRSQFSNLDSAALRVEFIPPYGPNYEQPPKISINSTLLGSIQPFFPPFSSGNWTTNPDGTHDFNDSLHVLLGIPKATLAGGENVLLIENGRPDDDYQFTNVKVMISYDPVVVPSNDTVKKYVAIGDGFTAGWQNNALYQSAQIHNFPNMLAAQLKAVDAPVGNFEQPLYSDPGTQDILTGKAARFEILSLVGPVIGPKGLEPGAPTNTMLARPYDNLGIHGAVIYDLLDTTNIATKALPSPQRNNPIFQLILRNQALFGKRIIDHAKVLRPDLITFWFGTVDILGYASAGGTKSIYMGAAEPTSNAVFSFLYRQAFDSLRHEFPDAKIVAANIPDVRAFPYFTTVGPRIAASIPSGIYLRYQKHGNSGPSMDSTILTESGAPLVCLTAVPFTSGLGQPTGAWYRYIAKVAGNVPVSSVISAGIDTTKPFGFDPRNPLPDALMLDAAEQATCIDAVTSFNATIASTAAVNGAILFDAHSFFNTVTTSGIIRNGMSYNSVYLTGRFFSLDGNYLSSRGNGIIANEFIKTMNLGFGLNIPPVDISGLPDISGLNNVSTVRSRPESCSLNQNFPNPFNPSTTIQYQTTQQSFVVIKILDLLGREIATLVNEEQSAGWKEVEWNASAFSSGIYFYKLTAGNFVGVKKLMLLK